MPFQEADSESSFAPIAEGWKRSSNQSHSPAKYLSVSSFDWTLVVVVETVMSDWAARLNTLLNLEKEVEECCLCDSWPPAYSAGERV